MTFDLGRPVTWLHLNIFGGFPFHLTVSWPLPLKIADTWRHKWRHAPPLFGLVAKQPQTAKALIGPLWPGTWRHRCLTPPPCLGTFFITNQRCKLAVVNIGRCIHWPLTCISNQRGILHVYWDIGWLNWFGKRNYRVDAQFQPLAGDLWVKPTWHSIRFQSISRQLQSSVWVTLNWIAAADFLGNPSTDLWPLTFGMPLLQLKPAAVYWTMMKRSVLSHPINELTGV